ncbi:hypothetical protein A3715_19320 [Oleiphilus sp. HI0009]|nr:hypothetical protein A3715_19320 [Oleiphilus sp. HI0009]
MEKSHTKRLISKKIKPRKLNSGKTLFEHLKGPIESTHPLLIRIENYISYKDMEILESSREAKKLVSNLVNNKSNINGEEVFDALNSYKSLIKLINNIYLNSRLYVFYTRKYTAEFHKYNLKPYAQAFKVYDNNTNE